MGLVPSALAGSVPSQNGPIGPPVLLDVVPPVEPLVEVAVEPAVAPPGPAVELVVAPPTPPPPLPPVATPSWMPKTRLHAASENAHATRPVRKGSRWDCMGAPRRCAGGGADATVSKLRANEDD